MLKVEGSTAMTGVARMDSSPINRLLLSAGAVLTIVFFTGAWWADRAGRGFWANALVELGGAAATLVLIDLLLPHLTRLVAKVQSSGSARVAKRIGDELALVEPAFALIIDTARGSGEGHAAAAFSRFESALQEKWGRRLTDEERDMLGRIVSVRLSEAARVFEERRDGG